MRQDKTVYLAVAGLVAIVLAVITLVLITTLEHRDPTQALGAISGYLMPAIVALVGMMGLYRQQSTIIANQEQQRSDINEVKDNVNGNTHRLTSELANTSEINRRLLAAMPESQIKALGLNLERSEAES